MFSRDFKKKRSVLFQQDDCDLGELSKNSGSCQEDEGFQCGGGQYPCLPHWKFDDNLAYAIGSGAFGGSDRDLTELKLISGEGSDHFSRQNTDPLDLA